MYHVGNANMPTHDWRQLAIRDLTPPEAGWQASIVEIDVPIGAVHPIARSTKCETFYYCDSGELEFDVNNQRFQVKAGDLVEIQPNEWYAYRAGHRSRKVAEHQCSALRRIRHRIPGELSSLSSRRDDQWDKAGVIGLTNRSDRPLRQGGKVLFVNPVL